jgi:hypothetical protein
MKNVNDWIIGYRFATFSGWATPFVSEPRQAHLLPCVEWCYMQGVPLDFQIKLDTHLKNLTVALTRSRKAADPDRAASGASDGLEFKTSKDLPSKSDVELRIRSNLFYQYDHMQRTDFSAEIRLSLLSRGAY